MSPPLFTSEFRNSHKTAICAGKEHWKEKISFAGTLHLPVWPAPLLKTFYYKIMIRKTRTKISHVVIFLHSWNTPFVCMLHTHAGWVCYAEKTHGNFILPYISSTKSPQQIMGSLVKQFISKCKEVNPTEIYHVTVMPCYDKKLEASREDFYSEMMQCHDVDCVITSSKCGFVSK